MSEFKSLASILSSSAQKEELYASEQKRRYYRSKKGHFTKNAGTFDFIHLIKNWESIVGPLMAKNTIPLKIKYKVLYINSKHSVFAQELGFLSPQIIEKIEKMFPSLLGKISKIKFSFSQLSSDQFTQGKKMIQSVKETKPKLHPYSPEYQKIKSHAKMMFSEIEDEEVRDALTRFLLNS